MVHEQLRRTPCGGDFLKQAIQERYNNSYDYDVGLYHLDIVKVTLLQRDADGVRTPQKSFA